MFDIGTKVRVVESNVPRRSTGPRRHSLGYVCRASKPTLNLDLNVYKYDITVAFFRYGNETRHRLEVKSVAGVFPAVGPSNETDERIAHACKLVRDHKYVKNVKAMQDPFSKDLNRPEALILVPVNNPADLCKASAEEQAAWLVSVVKTSFGLLKNYLILNDPGYAQYPKIFNKAETINLLEFLGTERNILVKSLRNDIDNGEVEFLRNKYVRLSKIMSLNLRGDIKESRRHGLASYVFGNLRSHINKCNALGKTISEKQKGTLKQALIASLYAHHMIEAYDYLVSEACSNAEVKEIVSWVLEASSKLTTK